MTRETLGCILYVLALIAFYHELPRHEMNDIPGGVVRLFNSQVFP